jgi:hypothetical protein
MPLQRTTVSVWASAPAHIVSNNKLTLFICSILYVVMSRSNELDNVLDALTKALIVKAL